MRMRQATWLKLIGLRTTMSESVSSESEVDWEDVEPLVDSGPVHQDGEEKPGTSASSASLEIVMQGAASLSKGKRKSKQHFFEKMMAAFNKELRCNLHKVHLLCLVSHGLKLSNQCDDHLLQSILLSLLPREHLYSKTDHYNQESLLKLLKWFLARAVQLSKDVGSSHPDSEFQSLTAVQLLVALMRVLSLRARLVLVLDPIPFKKAPVHSGRKSSQDSSASGSKGRRRTSRGSDGAGQEVGTPDDSQITQGFRAVESPEGSNGKAGKGGHGAQGTVAMSDVTTPENEPAAQYCRRKRKATKEIAGGQKKRRTSRRLSSAEADSSHCQADDDPCKSEPQRSKGKQSRRKGKSRAHIPSTECKDSPYFKKAACDLETSNLQSETLKEDVDSSGGESDRDSDSDYVPLRRNTRSSKVEFGGKDACIDDDDDDNGSDDVGAKHKGKKRRSQGKFPRGNRRTSSPPLAKKLRLAVDKSSSCEAEGPRSASGEHSGPDKDSLEAEELTPKCGEMYCEATSWVEVFVPSRRQWRSVHLPSCSIGQPQLCEKHSSRPLHYIIGIENDRTVCDVTARYASRWCAHVQRQRLSEEWWAETLRPLSPDQKEREEEEDDILSILRAHPFPTSISDYKNHSLYALRRHLLKFEAIYPEDSKILGSCRGEPIYAREHVYTLHTRETWLKDGRVVKKGEKPYKIVKARPKKGQSVLEAQNSTVETFGRWQTEEYVPPPVVDGKVPRNEYGNVELFQSSMLPPGACHIRIQGIQRVARKLGIDFAPAMMGWDFHAGYCHPILEGIVVAREYEEVLLEAWEQEEQVLIEKEIKKQEQRVLERWRRLTRGLLIKERVKRRYKLS